MNFTYAPLLSDKEILTCLNKPMSRLELELSCLEQLIEFQPWEKRALTEGFTPPDEWYPEQRSLIKQRIAQLLELDQIKFDSNWKLVIVR